MLGVLWTTRGRKRRCEGVCGQGRGRTADLTIFSRALYQLSYLTWVSSTGNDNGRRDRPL
jgi:hypothetical protein